MNKKGLTNLFTISRFECIVNEGIKLILPEYFSHVAVLILIWRNVVAWSKFLFFSNVRTTLNSILLYFFNHSCQKWCYYMGHKICDIFFFRNCNFSILGNYTLEMVSYDDKCEEKIQLMIIKCLFTTFRKVMWSIVYY